MRWLCLPKPQTLTSEAPRRVGVGERKDVRVRFQGGGFQCGGPSVSGLRVEG